MPTNIYVASPRNHRRNRSSWINLFKDLVEAGDLNTGDALQKDCLWFCFAELLQEDLDAVKEHWNTHRIRKSVETTLLLVFQMCCIICQKEEVGSPICYTLCLTIKLVMSKASWSRSKKLMNILSTFNMLWILLTLKSLLTGGKACNCTTNLCQYQYPVHDQLSKIVITPMIAKLFMVFVVWHCLMQIQKFELYFIWL